MKKHLALNTIAYHGTPHKFSEFSTGKMGTGEGAQAYGWGIYFAEKRDVADEYAVLLKKVYLDNEEIKEKPLARARILDEDVDIKVYYPTYPESVLIKHIKGWIAANRWGIDQFMEWIDEKLGSKYGLYSTKKKHRQFLVSIRNLAVKLAREKRLRVGSYIYTVDIPEKEYLLDWDRIKQPRSVEKALLENKVRIGKYPENAPMPIRKWLSWLLANAKLWNIYVTEENINKLTGYQIYGLIASDLTVAFNDNKEASLIFRDAGIPGLMYWDMLSRDAEGARTHNFVIWDERRIKIIGEPLSL